MRATLGARPSPPVTGWLKEMNYGTGNTLGDPADEVE